MDGTARLPLALSEALLRSALREGAPVPEMEPETAGSILCRPPAITEAAGMFWTAHVFLQKSSDGALPWVCP